ncbi:MAG: septal ring lytic transglycosylase RlpA family protein [Nitrosomonadales bacterium]|nr:septal ring lytic transglycosylase RlpA family protein [Nitrosomonadales bacterium]
MNKQAGLILLLFAATMLAACGGAPVRQPEVRSSPAPVAESQPVSTRPGAQPGAGGYLEGDGPGADAPANLDTTPDAVPKAEPPHPYANRPYAALGKTYTPLAASGKYKERGIASWYGRKFHGQRTSSGEVYDMYGMTAAHPTLPIPSYARVTRTATGKSVVVRVNDRGPFLHERIMDLSYTAALKLGITGNGSGEVEVESIAADTAVMAPLVAAEPVRTEPLPPDPAPKAAAPAPVAAPGSGNVYLQLGAFKSQQGAEGFLTRMRAEFEGSGKQLGLYRKDDLVRVHIGPYTSQDEARANAEKLHKLLGFKPLVNLH